MIGSFKYLLVIGLLCGVVRSVKIADLIAAEVQCIKEFPTITTAILSEFRKNTNNLDDYLQKHPDFACFLRCIGMRVNVITADGKINVDEMKELVHEVAFAEEGDAKAIVHEAVEKCVTVVGAEDHCEKVAEYLRCKVKELDAFKLKKEYCPECHE